MARSARRLLFGTIGTLYVTSLLLMLLHAMA
jgi:hypothetical protein